MATTTAPGTAAPSAGRSGPSRLSATLPAALAGIAEAGVVFLPVELVARNTPMHPTGGPLAWYPLFLALYAGGVALGTLLRDRPRMPFGVAAVCAAVGVVQSVAWNEGGGTGAFVAISLCLLAGVRVVALALHDWRDPIDASFGWGAGALLAEIAFAHAAEWGDIVWPIAVLFFLGSLASRAASVRLVERAVRGAAAGPDSARRWRLVGVGLVGSAAALTGVGLLLGTQKGPIDRLAEWLVQGIAVVLYYAALVVAVVVSWILGLLGVNGSGIRELLQRLGNRWQAATRGRGESVGSVPLWERAVGVTVLFLIVGALVYLVVRQRRKARAVVDPAMKWADSQDDEEGLFARASAARKRRKLRNELPEDSVRRLYAEALDELEERGRTRPASVTPGQFLLTIRRDLPDCAAGMGVLTRAYEDVRYGRIDLERATIDSLEAEWSVLRKAIRAAPRPDEEAEDDEAGATAAHLAERAEGAAGAAPSSDDTFGRR
jgi:hypothetical protein